MIEIVHVSSRGQIVIPERIRKKHKIRQGSRLVLREKGKQLILESEGVFEKKLVTEEAEDYGWLLVAEQSLKKDWDNEEEDNIWEEYL